MDNVVTQPGQPDPKKPEEKKVEQVNFSELSDEAFGKVFEDKRLWDHPRFKNLKEKADKAEEYRKIVSDTEAKKLEEEKKFQELADLRGKEAEELKTRLDRERIKNAISLESLKMGVVDVDAAVALIDTSQVKVNGDAVEGVKEAISKLKETKAYLFGATTLGSGTNPTTTNTAAKFKLSQMRDAEFFRKNEQAIMQAYASGNIENDLK